VLVIGRRPGQVLVIGDDIEIEILDTSGSQVKLGIRAPKSIPVVRQEILLVGRQNRAASRRPRTAALNQLLGKLSRRSNSPPPLR
jgi:carbon storage regulator